MFYSLGCYLLYTSCTFFTRKYVNNVGSFRRLLSHNISGSCPTTIVVGVASVTQSGTVAMLVRICKVQMLGGLNGILFTLSLMKTVIRFKS
jgi:hypothetical protein